MADEAGGDAVTIFTRYMVGRFAKPFVFGLGLFAVLIFLGDTFDKMNYIAKSKAPLGIILECLWLGVPYWAVRVIPMATLLATLVAMSGFVQSGEWLATQACGLETKRFWMPVLWSSLAVAALAFAAQETIMPAAWARSQRLWNERVHPEWEWTKYPGVALDGGEGRFIETWLFIPLEGRMNRPTLDQLGPEGGVVSQLDAKYALWNPAAKRWVFHDGVERTFGPQGVTERPFVDEVSTFDVAPLDLIPRPINPDEMTFAPSDHLLAPRRALRRLADLVPGRGLGQGRLPVREPGDLRARHTDRAAPAQVLARRELLRRARHLVRLPLVHGGRARDGRGRDLARVGRAWGANILFGTTALVLIGRWDL